MYLLSYVISYNFSYLKLFNCKIPNDFLNSVFQISQKEELLAQKYFDLKEVLFEPHSKPHLFVKIYQGKICFKWLEF